MYLKELPNTRTPYYYMSHLAGIAEKQGKPEEALDWMSKAYVSSEGPATRLRWGSSYVRALIRLSPNDIAGIRAAGLQVAGELSSTNAPRGRSRSYVEQIDKALKSWATTPERRTAAAAVIARFPRDTPGQPS
jgi:protein disulfide-isomerase